MSLILASQSPRRAQLLRQIGVNFRLMPAHIDETGEPGEAPADYVQRMAQTKARIGLQQASRQGLALPVLAADTAVVHNDVIYGKPRNPREGMDMLRQLSGNAHQVLSAVSIVSEADRQTGVAVTEVVFRHLDDDLIQRYWQFDEPTDKAGGYAIQGLGSVFVEKIIGSYSNVVGLPIETLVPLLDGFNVPYWAAEGKQ